MSRLKSQPDDDDDDYDDDDDDDDREFNSLQNQNLSKKTYQRFISRL